MYGNWRFSQETGLFWFLQVYLKHDVSFAHIIIDLCFCVKILFHFFFLFCEIGSSNFQNQGREKLERMTFVSRNTILNHYI